ncbi:hypothetical protein T07_15151 [Trichinella nelsoni]|uniref:Uncharacterized protein n=1 Tax=Trichinella nelsoni TaxID=6336 RepID=A0A0V0RHR3_9BILA|nr:hypothetical protein T07_15151 [Trichinella nelsoni]
MILEMGSDAADFHFSHDHWFTFFVAACRSDEQTEILSPSRQLYSKYTTILQNGFYDVKFDSQRQWTGHVFDKLVRLFGASQFCAPVVQSEHSITDLQHATSEQRRLPFSMRVFTFGHHMTAVEDETIASTVAAVQHNFHHFTSAYLPVR